MLLTGAQREAPNSVEKLLIEIIVPVATATQLNHNALPLLSNPNSVNYLQSYKYQI